MAKTRNRYVKVALFEAISTNLIGGTIVGQIDDWMLVERPQPKPRAAAKAQRKPRATNAKAAAQVAGAATSFPGAGASNG
jgi:hypothetical protein